jgi:hypothetical protein
MCTVLLSPGVATPLQLTNISYHIHLTFKIITSYVCICLSIWYMFLFIFVLFKMVRKLEWIKPLCRIIIKWNGKEWDWDVDWICTAERKGTSGGVVCTREWIFGLCEILGISWLLRNSCILKIRFTPFEFFFVIRARSLCPGCTAAFRLIVQPFSPLF